MTRALAPAVTTTTVVAVAATTSAETVATSDPEPGVRVAALYEAHGRAILGLCRLLLRDATEAEDAAQQSFLSAYRSLLGGVVPREPAAWLAAIARNECWSRIKRRMRDPLELELREVPSAEADPLEIAARNADFAAFRAGLESLSRPQREAFMLREFAGLSYRELALALGATEPAVDSLLFRARTGLRRALRSANGILVPVALREQLARLIPGFDQPAAGSLAKLASLPIAAKLAAAGAGAALVVAGSTGLDRQDAPAVRVAAPSAHSAAQDVAARPLRAVLVPRPARPVSARAAAPRGIHVRQPLTSPVPSRRPATGTDPPLATANAGDPPPADPGTVPVAGRSRGGDGDGVVTFASGVPPTDTKPDATPTGGPIAPTDTEPSDTHPGSTEPNDAEPNDKGTDTSGRDGSGSDDSGSDGHGSGSESHGQDD